MLTRSRTESKSQTERTGNNIEMSFNAYHNPNKLHSCQPSKLLLRLLVSKALQPLEEICPSASLL